MELSESVPIVVLASACWDTPTRVNCHEIASRFAARGHRVLFVESTGLRNPSLRRSAHDRRRLQQRFWSWLRGEREVEPNLFVISPLTLPRSGSAGLQRSSIVWLAHDTRRAMARLGIRRPVVWAFLPTHADAVARLDARLRVYHCVDHYAENPGVDAGWVDALEGRLMEQADVVLCSSPVLHERLRKSCDDVVLVPNVADVAVFSRPLREPVPEPADLSGIPRPRAVYVGNLARYRTNVAFLLAAARQAPDLAFVFVGPVGLGDVDDRGAGFDELFSLPNVRRLGPKAHAELPAYLHHCDAAVIPFLDNGHTRASLPLKLWEYVASGLPVVATDLPNLRSTGLGDALVLVHDADSFAREVARAARRSRAGGLALRERLSHSALGHDWSDRIRELRSLLAARVAAAEAQSESEHL